MIHFAFFSDEKVAIRSIVRDCVNVNIAAHRSLSFAASAVLFAGIASSLSGVRLRPSLAGARFFASLFTDLKDAGPKPFWMPFS
jgi:hypothetical protein